MGNSDSTHQTTSVDILWDHFWNCHRKSTCFIFHSFHSSQLMKLMFWSDITDFQCFDREFGLSASDYILLPSQSGRILGGYLDHLTSFGIILENNHKQCPLGSEPDCMCTGVWPGNSDWVHQTTSVDISCEHCWKSRTQWFSWSASDDISSHHLGPFLKKSQTVKVIHQNTLLSSFFSVAHPRMHLCLYAQDSETEGAEYE